SAALTSLQVSPAQPSVGLGESRRVSAAGVFSDLTTEDLTYTAAWSSSNPAVVAVGNDALGYQIITGLSPGTATLTANYGGVSGTTTVTVTTATLQTIQVTPFTPRLPVGFSTAMRATGIYSDNTTRELTYDVSWSSSAQGVAAVSPYGELHPVTPGTTTVTATHLGVSGSTVVTVSPATLSSIAVTPNMATLAVGNEQPFAASGTFSDGTMMDVTAYVTWLSSNRMVADVANAWPYQGSAKALSLGSCTITAVRGGVTGTAGVNVQ
ncbi:MAG: Ig-like domain-containing protein, partial [Myxococcaceae bacterium]|nr:Ig-like domain-containing protein [Myxococcaceae bacterium]